MLGLAQALPDGYSSAFVSFSEGGLCREFLGKARDAGFEAIELRHDTPHLCAARRELVGLLQDLHADLLVCHGYKADLIGLLAARKIGIPVVAVSRGWTWECLKVRLYEALDRRVLRRMDKVICVSEAQAKKVRGAGVHRDKVAVIHNAIRVERFADHDPAGRAQLLAMFPSPPELIVGAAGRLSPEKGFDVSVEAVALLVPTPCSMLPAPSLPPPTVHRPLSTGFVLFGDGPLRDTLARQIAVRGLQGRFILAGFRPDLDRLLPHLDLFVQSSHTEGLPNVVLEAQAAGVAVVATAVGGTPEVIEDGKTGCLVPPNDASVLAQRIAGLLSDRSTREMLAKKGRAEVEARFSFASQASAYCQILKRLVPSNDGPIDLASQKLSTRPQDHRQPIATTGFAK